MLSSRIACDKAFGDKSCGIARQWIMAPLHAVLTQRIYFGKQFLLSRGEGAFYRVLMQAVGGKYVVMAKVRLADVVDARANGRTWGNAFNRISRKHVDFVLLDARELTIRLVVELDDRSHRLSKRRERDAFVDEVLAEAGLAVLTCAGGG